MSFDFHRIRIGSLFNQTDLVSTGSSLKNFFMTETSNYNSLENKWKRKYLAGKLLITPTVCDRIKRFEEKKPIVRPPAVYDNKSREQRIDEILKA